MNFGLFLVKQGAITAEQFVEALEIQMRSKPLIGSLAIDMNKLNIRQVFNILRKQADIPNKMFGELALEDGLLNTDQLSTLLYHQMVCVIPLTEIIIERGYLTKAEIDQLLQKFRNLTNKMQDSEMLLEY